MTTTLKLNQIRIDGATQARVSINQAVVSEYAEALANNDKLPDPVVFFDGVDRWLADGFHRYHAHAAIGAVNIDVNQLNGTQADAKLYAYGANKAHGLRRTNEDKRKAVAGMLADFADWSDSRIGRHVGVDHKTVASHRASLGNSQVTEGARTYKTKHGTEATMNTASIGRAQAEEEQATTVATPRDTSAEQPGPVDRTTPAESSLGNSQVSEGKGAADENPFADFDPIKELETVTAELELARKDLSAATADDKAAEIIKWRRLCEVAQRRQNELMEQLSQRDQELQRMSRLIRQIGKAVGQDDPKRITRAVEDMAAQLAN